MSRSCPSWRRYASGCTSRRCVPLPCCSHSRLGGAPDWRNMAKCNQAFCCHRTRWSADRRNKCCGCSASRLTMSRTARHATPTKRHLAMHAAPSCSKCACRPAYRGPEHYKNVSTACAGNSGQLDLRICTAAGVSEPHQGGHRAHTQVGSSLKLSLFACNMLCCRNVLGTPE